MLLLNYLQEVWYEFRIKNSTNHTNNFVRIVIFNTFDDLKTKTVWQKAIISRNYAKREKRKKNEKFYFQIIDRNDEIYQRREPKNLKWRPLAINRRMKLNQPNTNTK